MLVSIAMSEEKNHFRIRKGDIEIEYSGKPSDVNRQFKLASEWVKGVIAVTPMPNVSEDKNKDRDEERQFQVEMLDIQLIHGSFTSFMTAMIAMAISWIAAMAVLSYSNVPTDVKSLASLSMVWMFILLVAAFVAFYVVSFVYMPTWQKNKLRKYFIEFKKTENPKQDPKETEPKEARDKIFLFYGIVMGAALGFFGNICASWYYDSYKSTAWWYYLGSIAFVIFFSALIVSAYKLRQWTGEMVKKE